MVLGVSGVIVGSSLGAREAPASAAHSESGIVPGDSGMPSNPPTPLPALTSQSGVCCLQLGALAYTPGG